MKGISVVIPNYNGRHLLEQTLPKVFTALSSLQCPHEIIVSDDASTDDSVAFIKDKFPSIQVIQTGQNKGFAPTINRGIHAARYELVLLLNSDVKLTAEYFKHLLPYFDKPDTFGVMGRIIGWNDDHIQDAAKYPAMEGFKIKTSGNYLADDMSKLQNGLYSFYLSGANSLVDRNKLLQLGGFDEIFAPFYVEDFELSLRAWRMGWKCYYEHAAICRHKTSETISAVKKKKSVGLIYDRNKMLMHAIHLTGWQRAGWYGQLIAETIGRALLFQWNYLRSVKAFINNKEKAVDSRKRFEKLMRENSSRLSVKAVMKFIRENIPSPYHIFRS